MKDGLQTEIPSWCASVVTTPARHAEMRVRRATCSSVGNVRKTITSSKLCLVIVDAIWSVQLVLSILEKASVELVILVAYTAQDLLLMNV
jgi:hypothetical protein